MAVSRQARVGVLGAGTMGSGIAQVAAVAGHDVVLADAYAPSLEKARVGLAKAFAREAGKSRMTAEAAEAAESRITVAPVTQDDYQAFRGCDVIIEAIVEDLAVKQRVFGAMEAVVSDQCILATNTSSLSVAGIAAACTLRGRVIGLHFFNPAPVLPLVEVVQAITSDAAVVQRGRELVDSWKKVSVIARDTPGFVVNRVARPFYGESLRIHEEGIADMATIDWAMTELGGFRMGPFELMDLIGNDVNFAVTSSVFEAMGYDPRYRPSITQRRMVEAGLLGRKTGTGYYDYRDGAVRPQATKDRGLGQRIVDRVVAMLINEAADAVLFRIASAKDVDLAMTKGVNYPRGLLAWADEIGPAEVQRRLAALQEEYGEDRYRTSALLRAKARAGERFHA
ncbi:MAG TPA: 3-hydroxyacyl-CoA dehydrogenase NAD-binding domain-containing protein [Gemmatimonadaceae bacterium]|nr:3-hydroxyacyl-CoA dehydrogenase NAD-binding domain-containing protein [Gemmatimonadaceae bacterium]